MKDDDKARIEENIKRLSEASASMAERLYGQHQAKNSEQKTKTASSDDNVVDAEYEDISH